MDLVSTKTELATVNNGANPYMIALTSRKFSELKKDEGLSFLIDLISKTYFECGQQIPGDNDKAKVRHLQALASALREEILLEFKFIRTEELNLAFRNGARLEYGEYFGLNIITFNKWLKGFVSDAKRTDALKKKKELEEAVPKPKMSASEAEYAFRQIVLKDFAKFKVTGILQHHFPAYVYEYLSEKGLINLSKTDKERLYDLASSKILDEKKLIRVSPKSREDLKQAGDWIYAYENDKLSKSQKAEIKQKAKYLALLEYYRTIENLDL